MPATTTVRATVLVTALVLGACAPTQSPPPADEGTGRNAAPAPVAPCTDLSTTRSTPALRTESEHLPALRLPCLPVDRETDSDADREIDLSALGGRPTVVNLWASWCAQCRAEMPLLRRAHTDYGAAVQFLGVNSKDRPDYAATVLADLGVTYPQVVDRDGRLLAELGIPGMPVTVILDPTGTITDTHIGPLRDGDLDALLAPLLTPTPIN